MRKACLAAVAAGVLGGCATSTPPGVCGWGLLAWPCAESVAPARVDGSEAGEVGAPCCGAGAAARRGSMPVGKCQWGPFRWECGEAPEGRPMATDAEVAEVVAPGAAVEGSEVAGGAPGMVVPAAREVLVPREALWLAEPLTASYGGMPASAVIREIAQGRPIRLTFDASAADDPVVSAPPEAVTVQDHLDAVCGQADWSYTVSVGTVLIHDIETRVFPLATPPGRSTARMQLRGLSGGDASGGGGAGNEVEVGLDPYAEEIVAFVSGMLGLGNGEEEVASDVVDERTSVVVLPSANAVSVTAKPHLMRQVERELARYNEITSRMVRLRITLYEVDVSGLKERSLDLAALRSATVGLGFAIAPEGGGMSGSAVRVEFDEGKWADGSGAVLRWLRTAGKASIAFEDAVEVRNNQVASVDATETRQFLERFSRETQTAGATQLDTPTVEFGELRLGWAIHLQPTVSAGRISVRIGLSRSSLVEERPFSFDDGAVAGTTHVTDDYNRVMNVSMRDGETRLLTMLANSSARETRRRVPWLPILGDEVADTRRDRETVMMLTAQVL